MTLKMLRTGGKFSQGRVMWMAVHLYFFTPNEKGEREKKKKNNNKNNQLIIIIKRTKYIRFFSRF